MLRVFISLLFLSIMSLHALAQEQQVIVPYTLADRDRAIRLEAKMEANDVKMEALESMMDLKLEAITERIDYLFWLQGVIVALILFMFGYMIWDRRTAMQPALLQSAKAEENSRNLIILLREYSKKHPDLAELLRTHGLL